ncbi:MAG: thymidine phosphorylase, partial [Acidobacteria bacterium]|nr:thymidine phosphorylase [Acidobacteriota bacterium]
MNIVEIIETKRDGGRLDEDQIRWFIDAYVRGDVAEEQAAALCMAIFFRDLDDTELSIWTDAMIRS